MHRVNARLVPLAVILLLAACATHSKVRTGLGPAGGQATTSPSAPGGGQTGPPANTSGSPSATGGPASGGSGSGSGGGGTSGNGSTLPVKVTVYTAGDNGEAFEPIHCPVAEPVDGTVTVDRGPVTVAYEWVRSTGMVAHGTLKFAGSGPQSMTIRDLVPIKAAISTTVTDQLVLPGRSYDRSHDRHKFVQECEPSASTPTTTDPASGTCPRYLYVHTTLDLPVVPIRVEVRWYGALTGPNSGAIADYAINYPAGSTLHPTVDYAFAVTGTGDDVSVEIVGPGQLIDHPFRSKPLALFCHL